LFWCGASPLLLTRILENRIVERQAEMADDTNKKAAIAAVIEAALGPHLRREAHRLGSRLDTVIPANSPLRSGWFERILLAASGAADVKIDNPVLKTILPTTGEMFAVAFWDGDEGVDREMERCRREAMRAISRSDNPDEQAVLFEQRLQALKRVADFSKSLRLPLGADKGKPDGLQTKTEAVLDRLADALERAAHMDFDEEQRTALETQEAELDRLKRERHFRDTSRDLDQKIAEERERLGK